VIEAEGALPSEDSTALSITEGKQPQLDEPLSKHQQVEREGPTPQPRPETKEKKPNPGTRGISFRTPPVFRSSTLPPGDDLSRNFPAHPLRQYRSDPTNSRPGSSAATHFRRVDSPKVPAKGEEGEAPMSQSASIVLLLVSTALVALCAEFLVGSIEHLVENSPISEAFIGLIILPIVGNAAEHVTAVTVAAKNKLDLALGVALGSSIQIALFVTPFVVILGWILDKDMSLYFSLFETGSLFVATFIVNFLVSKQIPVLYY
jgi:Ca2+:H+ antiporter